MKEIVSGIWTWSVFSEEKQMNFNGWYVARGAEAVIIDPPPLSTEDVAFIRSKSAPVAVLVTNKHHTRDSENIQKEFDIPIWVHALDAPMMDVETQKTYKDGGTLPGGFTAITLQDAKTPGESALLCAGNPSALVVGDAILGKPKGELSMLPDAKFKDPKAARAGLRRLLDFSYDSLLLGDGTSILSEPKKKLESFLAQ